MKSLVKKLVRSFGYEIKKYRPDSSDTARLNKLLLQNNIDLVLDVGANIGQYASGIRVAGYNGRILSFEPLASAHNVLVSRSRKDAFWDIGSRTAIGSVPCRTTINVSKNIFSSSILPMLDTHINAAPDSCYIGSEEVEVRRLDDVAAASINESKSVFLKIDTQGYEERVLDGVGNMMSKITGVQLELSLVPLYEGQMLYLDMIRKLAGYGLKLYGVQSGFTDNLTGRVLQCDGIFFR